MAIAKLFWLHTNVINYFTLLMTILRIFAYVFMFIIRYDFTKIKSEILYGDHLFKAIWTFDQLDC